MTASPPASRISESRAKSAPIKWVCVGKDGRARTLRNSPGLQYLLEVRPTIERALAAACRMGPSAMGSLKGMPSSTKTTPASSQARRS